MTASDVRTLSLRQLNRASLSRQLLLERANLPVQDAVGRIAGLQAQYSPSPYIGLWSRLHDFRREQLTIALEARSVVKATLMRSTLHIERAQDVPSMMAMVTAARIDTWRSEATRRGYDAAALKRPHERFLAYADREPRTQAEMKQLADELLPADAAQRYPSWRILDARGGLVHVPPSGTWRYHGTGVYRSARSWLPDAATPSREEAVTSVARLFLAAFGPASVEDFRKFSGERSAPRARAAFAALGDLVTYRDDDGRVLLDLPDVPLPGEDAPAPVRFLPKYESLVVAYDDRRRILPPDVAPAILQVKSADILASFLVDGFAAGTWRAEREKDAGRLVLTVLRTITTGDRHALEEEGLSLVRWLEPDAASHDVQLLGPQ